MISNRLLKVRLFADFQRNPLLEVTAGASAGDTAGCMFKCWLCGTQRELGGTRIIPKQARMSFIWNAKVSRVRTALDSVPHCISVSFSLSNTIPSIFIILRWSLEYCSMYCYRDVCLYFLSHHNFTKLRPQVCSGHCSQSGPAVVFPTTFHVYFKSVTELAERKLKGKKIS